MSSTRVGEADDEPPDRFLCEISYEVMSQPVVAKDGRTYDEGSIRRWVTRHRSSPMTREPLQEGEWFVNRQLKSEIEEWRTRLLPGSTYASAIGVSTTLLPSVTREESQSRQRQRIAQLEQEDSHELANFLREFVSEGDVVSGRADSRPPAVGVSADAGRDNTSPTVRATLGFCRHSIVVRGSCEDGRFLQFSKADVERVVGLHWAGQNERVAGLSEAVGVHVKGGQGAVLRARNQRTGKTGGVILWGVQRGDVGDACGCWNPAEFAAADDWRRGDVLDFLDFEHARVGDAAPLPVTRWSTNTLTGWNLPGEHAQFGFCGLVGHFWKRLEVEMELECECILTGVQTDSPDALAFSVSVLRDGGWILAAHGLTGAADVSASKARRVRVTWEDTDLHKIGGLSTARSGGGLHVRLFGLAMS